MKLNRILYGAALASLLLVSCTANEEESEKSAEDEAIEKVNQKIQFGKDDAVIQEALSKEEGIEKVELDSSSDGKALFLDVYVTSIEFASSEALLEKYIPQLKVLHPEAKMDIVFVHGTNTIVYEKVVERKE